MNIYVCGYLCIFFTLVIPNSYTISQSNQFDSNFQCLQDDQCVGASQTEFNCSGEQLLLCTGPNSTLFDGIIGRGKRRGSFEQIDISRHYTWQPNITASPSIAMSFDVPLVELPNITLYFLHEKRIRVPDVSMCFSRNLNFIPCNNINLPDRPRGIDDGVVEWPITLRTNATSVRYLRINFHYNRHDVDDLIFLSEIRISERLQGS